MNQLHASTLYLLIGFSALGAVALALLAVLVYVTTLHGLLGRWAGGPAAWLERRTVVRYLDSHGHHAAAMAIQFGHHHKEGATTEEPAELEGELRRAVEGARLRGVRALLLGDALYLEASLRQLFLDPRYEETAYDHFVALGFSAESHDKLEPKQRYLAAKARYLDLTSSGNYLQILELEEPTHLKAVEEDDSTKDMLEHLAVRDLATEAMRQPFGHEACTYSNYDLECMPENELHQHLRELGYRDDHLWLLKDKASLIAAAQLIYAEFPRLPRRLRATAASV
jgi:hypothetical protein